MTELSEVVVASESDDEDEDEDDDDDDDDDDDEIWKKEKDYTSKIESYMTLYLYKGKVIGQGY